jgi:predicted NAD/FAD-dependent oxidoreductase
VSSFAKSLIQNQCENQTIHYELKVVKTPSFLKSSSATISGFYFQKSKGISTETEILIVHASASFSFKNWSTDDEQLVEEIQDEAQRVLAANHLMVQLEKGSLHR